MTMMSSEFHLCSPGGVTSDNVATCDCSTPDVWQIIAVQMLPAWRRNWMLHKHRVGAALQHCEQPVRLGRWPEELGLGSRVVDQLPGYLVDEALPRSLPARRALPAPWLVPAVAVHPDDVTGSSQRGAVRRSVPQPTAERAVAVIIF